MDPAVFPGFERGIGRAEQSRGAGVVAVQARGCAEPAIGSLDEPVHLQRAQCCQALQVVFACSASVSITQCSQSQPPEPQADAKSVAGLPKELSAGQAERSSARIVAPNQDGDRQVNAGKSESPGVTYFSEQLRARFLKCCDAVGIRISLERREAEKRQRIRLPVWLPSTRAVANACSRRGAAAA